jgi:hypothetical protein
MKNRIASAVAVALLGLTFSASATFAADEVTDPAVDASTEVAVDPVNELVTDTAVEPAADETIVVDPAAEADTEVAPEAMRALTMGAPMAANTPVEQESSSPVLPIALAVGAAAGAGYVVRRRRALNS